MKQPKQLIALQKRFFDSGQSRDISFIKKKLKTLKTVLMNNEAAIYDAAYKDFKKPKFEVYGSEIGLLILQIDKILKNLQRWSKTKRVKASKLNFPSRDYVCREPYGTVMVISPWNYPFLLSLSPAISAIAAGNTLLLKPSEMTPHSAELIKKIISEVFDNDHFCVELGGVDETTMLLKQRWDYIFFTGSVSVGKIIAKAAAIHLTPVTLELGGKNPCIVDATTDLKLTAKRLVWGKFFNAGQTCIAPDYILAKKSIKLELIKLLKLEINKAYGENPELSPNYPRIVNAANYKRLNAMLSNVAIVHGGDKNEEENYIGPTIVDNPSLDSKLMEGEIFGPILPILGYGSESDIETIVKSYEKSLALYVFSKNKTFYNAMIKRFSFGGAVVNDSMIHFGNQNLPFGGVGESGIGVCNGRFGHYTFTHQKSIVIKYNWLDLPLRYAPYKNKLKLLKKAFRWLG